MQKAWLGLGRGAELAEAGVFLHCDLHNKLRSVHISLIKVTLGRLCLAGARRSSRLRIRETLVMDISRRCAGKGRVHLFFGGVADETETTGDSIPEKSVKPVRRNAPPNGELLAASSITDTGSAHGHRKRKDSQHDPCG